MGKEGSSRFQHPSHARRHSLIAGSSSYPVDDAAEASRLLQLLPAPGNPHLEGVRSLFGAFLDIALL